MPETDLEGFAQVFRQWVSASVRDEPDWFYGAARMKQLAQDQSVLEFDRGGGPETFYARRIRSGDAQSEAIQALAASRGFQAVLEVLGTHFCRAWAPDEVCAEHEWLFDLDGGAAPEEWRDEEVDVPDESSVELTADHLARQLVDRHAEVGWAQLRELIPLAEDMDFSPEQSRKLAPRLLEYATTYRDSTDPQDKPVVWSAIRTGASMLRPDEAGRLRPLLEPGHPVETSLVTVKMLGRIFEAQPPSDLNQYPELAHEVRQIADSLLNRYAIAVSQGAAMAQLAVYALAAMGSDDAVELSKAVRGLGQSWFTAQLRHELRALWEYWTSQPAKGAPKPRELLERAIQELSVR